MPLLTVGRHFLVTQLNRANHLPVVHTVEPTSLTHFIGHRYRYHLRMIAHFRIDPHGWWHVLIQRTLSIYRPTTERVFNNDSRHNDLDVHSFFTFHHSVSGPWKGRWGSSNNRSKILKTFDTRSAFYHAAPLIERRYSLRCRFHAEHYPRPLRQPAWVARR